MQLRRWNHSYALRRPVPRSKNRWLRAGRLALFCALSACSTYSAKESPDVRSALMPYRHRLGLLSLGADAYSQATRQEEMFGENLTKIAVLPVHVVVTNGMDLPVSIAPANFKLALPNAEAATPRPSYEVSTLLAPEIGIADYAAAGVGALGGIGGAIGAIAGRVVSFLGAAALDWSRTNTLQARGEDYERKGLKAVTLGKNQSAGGFLFFVVPPGTAPFDDALLLLEIRQSDNQTLKLSLALKGLGYKGLPAAKPTESENDSKPDGF